MRYLSVFSVIFSVLFSVLSIAPAYAANPEHYTKISPPLRIDNEDKIVIQELFWYSCPHCFHFEATLEPWKAKLPADVHFEQVPAVFSNGRVEYLARAHYTAEALGILEKMKRVLFRAYHVDKTYPKNDADIKQIFLDNGVDGETFDKTYHSFGVDSLVRKARKITIGSRASAVPNIVFNGKYLVNTDKVDGYKGMLELLDELIVEERKRMAEQK